MGPAVGVCDPRRVLPVSFCLYRYDPYLRLAVQQLVAQHDPEYTCSEFWVSWYGFDECVKFGICNSGCEGYVQRELAS